MAFGGILKQSTAVDVLIGPFVDATDGDTEETALTIAQANVKLSKNGQALAQKNDATTCVHDADGYYNCELDATDTNTVGQLTLKVHVSGALGIRLDFQVMEEAVYDALFAAAAAGYLKPTVDGRTLDVTAGGCAGVDWGNMENKTTANDLTGTKVLLGGGAHGGSSSTLELEAASIINTGGNALILFSSMGQGLSISGSTNNGGMQILNSGGPAVVASGTDYGLKITGPTADVFLGGSGTIESSGGNVVVVATDATSRTASKADMSALATAAELAKVPKSDGTASWNNTAKAAINAEVLDVLNVDTLVAGVTVAEALRRIGGLISGIVTGAGTGTETFQDYAESANTIVITVDSSGNRSAITYN